MKTRIAWQYSHQTWSPELNNIGRTKQLEYRRQPTFHYMDWNKIEPQSTIYLANYILLIIDKYKHSTQLVDHTNNIETKINKH